MAQLIEDYALIGDTRTVALVGRNGSIDWWCAPRFDGPALFAALLDTKSAGRWRLAPKGKPKHVERSYVGDTMVLETVTRTKTGTVVVRDVMPIDVDGPSVVRVVECLEGTVEMRSELTIRFDYGAIVPWVREQHHAPEGWYGVDAVGGGDGLTFWSQVQLTGEDHQTMAEFTMSAGDQVCFEARWHASHDVTVPPLDGPAVLEETRAWWQDWSEQCTFAGRWHDQVLRSLLTLKALTFAPSGGIVAAATTSLPEWIGGVRNWDYRYCWLRDATFTLHALLDAGYVEEARAWGEWLRRSVAGDPDEMQIMYGVTGERRLAEYEVDHLAGYEGSAPVRVGNGAAGQFQLDVYGEVMDMFHSAAVEYRVLPHDVVDLSRFLVEHVRSVWTEPDDGIWEVRGPRRHFVHSKVMAWVAVDRWLGIIDLLDLDEDPTQWRDLRDEIHRQICEQGYDHGIGSFTQYYGSTVLDASCLMIGLVGFLPPTDPRVVGTVDAIAEQLVVDGFVQRYQTDAGDDGATVDGLPPGEGAFLLTTFWLVDNLVLLGRRDEAEVLFDRLLELTNDVGLLSEEYDVASSRMLGNVPQAFSHVGLVNSAYNLTAPPDVHQGTLRRRARPASVHS